MKNLLLIISLLLIVNLMFANIEISSGNDFPKENKQLKKDKKFSDKKGKFRIQFPGEPKKEKKVVETAIGDLDMFTFTCVDGNDVYMVAFTEFGEKINELNTKDLVQKAKGGFISSINLEIIEEKEFKINDNYGVRVEAKNDKYYTVLKLFLANNILYQLVIIVAGDHIDNKSANNFLDSFELLKKK